MAVRSLLRGAMACLALAVMFAVSGCGGSSRTAYGNTKIDTASTECVTAVG